MGRLLRERERPAGRVDFHLWLTPDGHFSVHEDRPTGVTPHLVNATIVPGAWTHFRLEAQPTRLRAWVGGALGLDLVPLVMPAAGARRLSVGVLSAQPQAGTTQLHFDNIGFAAP